LDSSKTEVLKKHVGCNRDQPPEPNGTGNGFGVDMIQAQQDSAELTDAQGDHESLCWRPPLHEPDERIQLDLIERNEGSLIEERYLMQAWRRVKPR